MPDEILLWFKDEKNGADYSRLRQSLHGKIRPRCRHMPMLDTESVNS